MLGPYCSAKRPIDLLQPQRRAEPVADRRPALHTVQQVIVWYEGGSL